jgi:Zn-dependent peptidase ImmA (M78 family)/transcriptional regulator with XRE-family HTH domain
MPKVNPKILVWARETAGFSQDEAARKLISGAKATERLAALEAGELEPSRPLLVKMAERYRRPLVAFYLTEAPDPSPKGVDFRTLAAVPTPEEEALLDALLRQVIVRHELVKTGLEELEEAEPLALVGSGNIRDGVQSAVEALGAFLNVDRKDFRARKNYDSAFRFLRDATERAGVYVLLMGNLGSHHSNIDARSFRGFALADPIAPFVVVNENDSRSAWSFTLLHELTHIWLGQTGVSGYAGESDAEKFCDSVAAAFLLERSELAVLTETFDNDIEHNVFQIGLFAHELNVSRKMVAYNLMRVGLISQVLYRQLSARFDEERLAFEAERDSKTGGPDYYVVRRHRIGTALIETVTRLLNSRTLTTTEAGKILGVKPTNVGRLLSGNEPPAASLQPV